MLRTRTELVLAVALSVAAAAAPCAAAEPLFPLSPRIVSYTIEARLDPRDKSLEGRETLTWRNEQLRPTTELWFHLYWNAWRNDRSTWMLEDRLRGGEDQERDRKRIREGDWGWIEVDSVRLHDPEGGLVDLDGSRRFAAPDDANADDRTVMVVELPREVRPGESVTVEIEWRSRVPRTFARTGRRGDTYLLSSWFPELGVYEPDGWSCRQFHAATEFYSDFGVFDVRLGVPSGWVVGATGREVERRDEGDGTTIHHYRQADVHTFAWTTSPDYLVREARFEEPGLPPVELRLLMQPEHVGQLERHVEATRAALRGYGTWYGAYPYDHLTVVDPAWKSGHGGMEYPTFFTAGTRLLNPPGDDVPESVTIHEAGHQFWYGVVANDQVDDAWLDEGLNTFSTVRTLERAYGPRVLVRRYLRDFVPVRFPEIEVPRWERRWRRYREHAGRTEPQWKSTWRHHPATAHVVSYDKTALTLATLERRLGSEVIDRALAAFFERARFRHPSPDEFLAVVVEVAGHEVEPFLDQALRGEGEFDYAVDRVDSVALEPRGWFEREGRLVYVEPSADPPATPSYRTEVIVRRLGVGTFPVDVRLVFDDGHEVRETWDGVERWRRLVVEHPSRLAYAEVDPDRVLMLDVDRTNNTRLREPAGRLPALKWASKWMIWFQDRLTTWTFFV